MPSPPAFLMAPALAVLLALPAAADTALMPVKFLDTSHEAEDQVAAHEARLAIFTDILADELDDDVTLVTAEQVAAACQPETPECLVALARDQGADRALFVVVQKTSTLIMQAFAHLIDTQAETVAARRDLNFRGDSDESWQRAARFLARDLR